MADQRGWPDAANPGVPTNPDQEGPHWIEDEFGRQRWFWWDPHTGAWSGASRQEPPLIAGERWTYIGGAVVPQRSAGFQTQVTDQLRRPPRQ
jgi:hypothetical protein